LGKAFHGDKFFRQREIFPLLESSLVGDSSLSESFRYKKAFSYRKDLAERKFSAQEKNLLMGERDFPQGKISS
jgi:hypothetical protein